MSTQVLAPVYQTARKPYCYRRWGIPGMRIEWSPDEHTTFLRMAKEGKRPSEIAAVLTRRSREAVLKHGRHHGIMFPRRSTQFTQEEDEKLAELIKQSISWAKIGKALGKEESSIRSAANRLGLTKKWAMRYSPRKPTPKQPARKCLKCCKSFRPTRPKIFVCTPCKGTIDWQDSQWMQEVI